MTTKMSEIFVIKRDGTKQQLDLDKIYSWLNWACNGNPEEGLPVIRGVSPSSIMLRANPKLANGIKTKDIQEMLIKANEELITEDTPNYDHVGARLVWGVVRREAFRSNKPPSLQEVIKTNTDRGFYTKELQTWYTEEELTYLDNCILHNRDDLFRYAGAEQMRKKYLIQHRGTKTIYESFQFAYMLAAMTMHNAENPKTRLQTVKDTYDEFSLHAINLPTPIMAGCRTPKKQFSSCTLIEAGDNLPSIKAVMNAIIDYAAAMAGIGVGCGRLRAEGQSIRGGQAISTGLVGFIKAWAYALKSVAQGAVRGASANFNFIGWHLEFPVLIEMKNEKTMEDKRVSFIDYTFHLNKLAYKRLQDKGQITLFSPEQVPDLYDAFYSPNHDEYTRLYEKYEADSHKRKTKMDADKYFAKLVNERVDTGRIYVMNADLVNTHTPFYEPITMTNLCVEVLLPTKPLNLDNTMEGLIALCTLGAINIGKYSAVWTPEEEAMLEKTCYVMVKSLDSLLDYQDYPNEAAERHTKYYRPLGVGIIDFAHWLARNGLRWGEEESLIQVERMIERVAFYLTKASILLAKERGACPARTKYTDGLFPKDYSKLKCNTEMDWDSLKEMVLLYGIRNSTLMAQMPSETSSVLSNATNGIEPPRMVKVDKTSKEGSFAQIIPEYSKHGHRYEFSWDIPVPNYLRTLAVLQKYMDQSISANTTYDPNKGNLKMSVLTEHLVLAYSLGIKTLYYNNVNTDGEIEDDGCSSGACKI